MAAIQVPEIDLPLPYFVILFFAFPFQSHIVLQIPFGFLHGLFLSKHLFDFLEVIFSKIHLQLFQFDPFVLDYLMIVPARRGTKKRLLCFRFWNSFKTCTS